MRSREASAGPQGAASCEKERESEAGLPGELLISPGGNAAELLIQAPGTTSDSAPVPGPIPAASLPVLVAWDLTLGESFLSPQIMPQPDFSSSTKWAPSNTALRLELKLKILFTSNRESFSVGGWVPREPALFPRPHLL